MSSSVLSIVAAVALWFQTEIYLELLGIETGTKACAECLQF